MREIKNIDLFSQYLSMEFEINSAIKEVLNETSFINGKQVLEFQTSLASYLDVKHIIPCGNGTDALQIAMMALDLKEGDEVIMPAFTYAAVAEVVTFLKLKPVLVDVDDNDFNIDVNKIEEVITSKTKAIVPVHLFGQGANMEAILEIAKKYNLFIIEDNAQSIGADYLYTNGTTQKLGTIGHVGTTSFFPTKNLGAFGDGGALMTNDDALAKKIRMICNHGQLKKYQHEIIGVNSRLDTIQAAILDVKLKHINNYSQKKIEIADYYDLKLRNVDQVKIPERVSYSNHVFHQYVIKVEGDDRDGLKLFLEKNGIQTMVYYPISVNNQIAYRHFFSSKMNFPVSEGLCKKVLALPIHSEMNMSDAEFVCSKIEEFYNK